MTSQKEGSVLQTRVEADGAVVRYAPAFFTRKTSRKAFQELEALFESAKEETGVLYGKQWTSQRRTIQFADPGVRLYRYSGSSAEDALPFDSNPTLDHIRRRVSKACDTPFNFALVNFYPINPEEDPTKDAKLGWHSDDEGDMVEGSTIASVSLGMERRFRIREKEDHDAVHFDEKLANGSLLTMEGECQKIMEHCIWAMRSSERAAMSEPGMRINITLRMMKPAIKKIRVRVRRVEKTMPPKSNEAPGGVEDVVAIENGVVVTEDESSTKSVSRTSPPFYEANDLFNERCVAWSLSSNPRRSLSTFSRGEDVPLTDSQSTLLDRKIYPIVLDGVVLQGSGGDHELSKLGLPVDPTFMDLLVVVDHYLHGTVSVTELSSMKIDETVYDKRLVKRAIKCGAPIKRAMLCRDQVIVDRLSYTDHQDETFANIAIHTVEKDDNTDVDDPDPILVKESPPNSPSNPDAEPIKIIKPTRRITFTNVVDGELVVEKSASKIVVSYGDCSTSFDINELTNLTWSSLIDSGELAQEDLPEEDHPEAKDGSLFDHPATRFRLGHLRDEIVSLPNLVKNGELFADVFETLLVDLVFCDSVSWFPYETFDWGSFHFQVADDSVKPFNPRKDFVVTKSDTPKQPQKPLPSFLFFAVARKAKIVAANPSADPKTINAMLVDAWGSLKDEEKKIYTELANKDKRRYEQELAAMNTVLEIQTNVSQPSPPVEEDPEPVDINQLLPRLSWSPADGLETIRLDQDVIPTKAEDEALNTPITIPGGCPIYLSGERPPTFRRPISLSEADIETTYMGLLEVVQEHLTLPVKASSISTLARFGSLYDGGLISKYIAAKRDVRRYELMGERLHIKGITITGASISIVVSSD